MKVNVKRLRALERALRDADRREKYFNMGAFQIWEPRKGASDPNYCGTPACAFGHYVARKDLQSELEFRQIGGHGPIICERGGSSVDAFDYAREHFGITEEESYDLFGPEGCGRATNARQAAEYVRDFTNQLIEEGRA